MASGDRFYLLELAHRPALWGDIGSLLKIEGVIVGGEGAQAVLLLPDFSFGEKLSKNVFELSPDVWSEWLRQSDNPEILINGSLEKAFHRKLRYDISGHVQQKIWAADGFKCVYCGAPMGKSQLTIDHFYPLEQNGKNDPSNYLSCCRRDNKDKGAMSPQSWCSKKGLDFNFFLNYLSSRRVQ